MASSKTQHGLNTKGGTYKVEMSIESADGKERRIYRRHDLEQQSIEVRRVDQSRQDDAILGRIVDLSAGGVRIRTAEADVRADHQIRVRLELPNYAGISPFIDTTGPELKPKKEWVGWMTVSRVNKANDGQLDVAGQLIDMDEMDRGMLGLYLSTQPLAA